MDYLIEQFGTCFAGCAPERRRTTLLLAWIVVVASFSSVFADSYILNGSVVVQTLDRAGTVQHIFRAPFTANSGDGAWNIRVQYGTAYSETCGFNGKEFRSVLEFNPTDFPAEATKGGTKVATMTMNDYPYHSEPTTRFVWLALYSNPDLVGEGKFIPALWNMPFQNPRSHTIKASNIEWLDQVGGRIRKVDFVQSKHDSSMLRSNVFLSSKTASEEIDHAFDGMRDGAIAATYKVGATTNFDGRALPLSFEMAVFAGVDENAPFVTQKYLGTIERIDRIAQFEVFPEAAGKVSVRDYRVFDRENYVDGLSYNCTNGWIASDSPALQELLKREIPRARDAAAQRKIESRVSPRGASVVVIGFAVLSLIGLFLAVHGFRFGVGHRTT